MLDPAGRTLVSGISHASGLDGKVVLITGGAGATGAAHGEVFAAAGAKVVLSDTEHTAGEAIARKIADAVYTPLDVTSPRDWAAAVDFTMSTFGQINALINNAGICPVASLDDTSAKLFTEVLAVNTVGTLLGMQAVARVMKPDSVILNIASIDGLRGVPGLAAYGASKAAVKTLSKTAAHEFFTRQTALPHAMVATSDPSWRERYWVSFQDTTGGNTVLTLGLGCYPNQDVMEAFLCKSKSAMAASPRPACVPTSSEPRRGFVRCQRPSRSPHRRP